jgi:Ca-activated chloride channel family protein
MTRSLIACLLLAAHSANAENVVLVLDASGSMWGQIGTSTKIESARTAVADLLLQWKADDALGLVAYGHRRKGDCGDIETLIPYGPLDAKAYLATVNQLNPKGMTPLSAAVIQAADSLKISEQKATVILVSDGEETCELDPCQVGKELEARGVDFTAHVIGFDVPNPAHQAQLRCLAENTGGRYFNARDAAELRAALGTLASVSTEAALPPAAATLDGPASAAAVSSIEVQWTGPADGGDYIAIVRADGAAAREHDYAWVRAGTPQVSLDTPADAGTLELRYVSPRRDPAVLARQPITITPAAASLDAPAEAVASMQVKVIARGPVSPRHWIGFAPKGSPAGSYLDYGRPSGATSELELRAPAEPGEYELRYVLNESELVLATRPIRITPAQGAIEAPQQAEIGAMLTVKASGPAGSGDWIGLAPAGSPAGSYLDYQRPSGPVSVVELTAPVVAGDYEIRYVINESEKVLHSHAIRIVDGKFAISGPAEVRVGERITVRAEGPVSSRHWIGFAPAGGADGEYRDYARPTAAVSMVELTAPDEPGDYELRYVLNEGERVIARQPIRVLAQ